MRNLILVLGDQLDIKSFAFAGFDAKVDRILMVEAVSEAGAVWSHKARIVLFISAMRHFRDLLVAAGMPVDYSLLAESADRSLADIWAERIARHRPARVIVCEPGEYRIKVGLEALCTASGVPLELRQDRHFLISQPEFAQWAGTRKTLLMETFYRHMRKQSGVLMVDGKPVGGVWNFDTENRGGFPRAGPGEIPAPAWFDPDALTLAVMREVEAAFPAHPGSLSNFGWPVTRDQALVALDRFVNTRLAGFGRFQDAMWTATPFGWHAMLSTSLNLKLLDPREVIDAALAAWRTHDLPLPAVEGFIRQIIGWREFMRGVYWLDMPTLGSANHFNHARALPSWYWTARTSMNCMRETIGQTLDHGYAHHIQRLMVTGNFALLAGIAPAEVHRWYLAVYVDAVEWVKMPNTLGMARFANGGRFTSKPYVASGAYIKRMSNYCSGCRYKPELRHGEKACPITTLYWNFLATHESELKGNMRTMLMLRNLVRLPAEERIAISNHAQKLLQHLDSV